MASLKRNIIANFAGRGWNTLLSLILVPVYIALLGPESWGLVTLFGALQGILIILEAGFGTAIQRELAALSTQNDSAQQQHDAVRTVESLFLGIAAAVALLFWMSAPTVTQSWLNNDSLPDSVVSTCFIIMGLLLALNFPGSLYFGGLMGLQQQTIANVWQVILASIRGLGAVGVLLFIDQSIVAFFVWQLLVTCAQTIIFRTLLWARLPTAAQRGRCTKAAFMRLRGVAGAMGLNAIASVFLTQMDKIILSSLLDLKTLGYYGVASAIAAGLMSIILPFNAATFPRLTAVLSTHGAQSCEFRSLYHHISQLTVILFAPIALLVIAAAPQLIYVWTGDDIIVREAWVPACFLIAGTLLYGLASPANDAQLAAAQLRVRTITYGSLTVLAVPAVYLLVPLWGATAAAVVWLAVNAIYMLITIPLMHRSLLQGEGRTWLMHDLLPGLLTLAGMAYATQQMLPMLMPHLPRLPGLFLLGFCFVLMLLSAALSTPLGRQALLGRLRKRVE